MVNYVCYRCGYTVNHKSKIIYHLNRKYRCLPKKIDIQLDDCKESILKGLSYEEYLEESGKVSNGFKPDEIVQKETKFHMTGTKKNTK